MKAREELPQKGKYFLPKYMRVGLSTVEMFPGLGVIFKPNKTFELSTCYRSNLRTICPIKCCGLGLSLTGLEAHNCKCLSIIPGTSEYEHWFSI